MPKQFYKTLLNFTPAIGWGILIIYFSIKPGDELPDRLLAMNDKFLHGFIYFFSAILLYMGGIGYDFSNQLSRKRMIYILLICIFFGLGIELVQAYFIPKREGDWKDFLANTFGAFISLGFMRFSHRFFAERFKA